MSIRLSLISRPSRPISTIKSVVKIGKMNICTIQDFTKIGRSILTSQEIKRRHGLGMNHRPIWLAIQRFLNTYIHVALLF